MNSLLDNSLLNLVAIAVVTSGGIFVAVVLSGLVAALVLLGVFELFSRAKIQRGVLQKFADCLWRSDAEAVQSSLAARYRDRFDQKKFDLKRLRRMQSKGELFSGIARMEARTFYKLHYRQLCGQLAAIIASEADRSELVKYNAPLSNTLVFIAEARGREDESDPEPVPPDPAPPPR